MSHEFWHPLMGTTKRVRVGYLDREAARDFLTNPWEDFPLDYDEQALRRLLRAAGGHPFLLQHLGWFLLERFNDRLRRDPDTPLVVTDADARRAVAQVLAESNYFDALYGDLPEEARRLVCALARAMPRAGAYVPLDALPQVDESIWQHLLRRQIVQRDARRARARLYLDLLRRWLKQHCV